ncbi:protein EARLY FLOWERING 3-like isoform X1 [Cucurbita moschata]|uniref:Protein EARLY FLOWERING 3-like isoform X1 n=2 Tax=Cucurbita moschata TaxID=3662 RepID=A0A6J1GIU5_CUCMO|nr:protein EARLY FLOWERING 3-like isoform X1 [Cucurbita moschata]
MFFPSLSLFFNDSYPSSVVSINFRLKFELNWIGFEFRMKRGRDDEKRMEPMFPRLHINDTEKGCPRAPPRNKMALYEQFTVPLKRSTPGVLPLPTNISRKPLTAPSSSQFQGRGTDGNLRLNSSSPTPNQIGNSHAHPSSEVNVNPASVQLERRQQTAEVEDEDDFTVPVYNQSEMGKNRVQNSDHKEQLSFPGSKHSDCSTVLQSSSVAQSSREVTTRKTVNDKRRDGSAKSTTNLLDREGTDGLQKETNVSEDQEFQDKSNISVDKLQDSDVQLQRHSSSSTQLDESGLVEDVIEPTRFRVVDSVPCTRVDSHSLEKNENLNMPVDNIKNRVDRTHSSVHVGNADKSDIVSENSMVDSISGSDICPDDVVGLIGQKRFWKARRAIINQQRVFDVQVFELHRLIKVQRLIAGSPHLLFEDGIFLDNSPPSRLPTKKLSSDYAIKSHVELKHNDDPKKPKHNVECSAENAVGKTSLSPAPVAPVCCQPSTNGPYKVNRQPTSVSADNKLSSWYQPSAAHQWLVPVLSPSEGLVYKPYPAPGFMYGGCAPYGPMTPIMNPSYGFPASAHHGIGALPSTPMVGGTYFHPYGMPVMNPGMSGLPLDQVNWYTGDQNQLSGGVAAYYMQHQTSYDVSTQRDRDENQETVSLTAKSQAPKSNELQASTASSPPGKLQGNEANRTAESHDVLPLFPIAQPLTEEGPQPSDSDQTKRVIRVVPHNRRSANESAARIFQSIQNERKQYDSI